MTQCIDCKIGGKYITYQNDAVHFSYDFFYLKIGSIIKYQANDVSERKRATGRSSMNK